MNRPVGPRLRLSGLIGEARCQFVPHFRVFQSASGVVLQRG